MDENANAKVSDGRHQPAWDFMRGPLGYLARNSYLLQSGVPKMDVAFYQKFTTYTATSTNYESLDLLNAGGASITFSASFITRIRV